MHPSVCARNSTSLFSWLQWHCPFNLQLQHSWSLDTSNCRQKARSETPLSCVSTVFRSVSPQSDCVALRHWRQQQILTGDTRSIKGTLQHPDVLWRASRWLPGRSNVPPHTSSWYQRLFLLSVPRQAAFSRNLLMFDGHAQASPWRSKTAAFHVRAH